ncbi:MAG: hypothetical protein OXU71_09235 [Gammaproteobacteria bacterium]|nr:hypothetical protein [Gammaproteobacteria bacterium]MDD9885060.1 hypothetical protein [Gammaproteobacteria bacterium]
MRKDVRQIAVLFIAGGVLEAAITGQILEGLIVLSIGVVGLLAAHHRS